MIATISILVVPLVRKKHFIELYIPTNPCKNAQNISIQITTWFGVKQHYLIWVIKIYSCRSILVESSIHMNLTVLRSLYIPDHKTNHCLCTQCSEFMLQFSPCKICTYQFHVPYCLAHHTRLFPINGPWDRWNYGNLSSSRRGNWSKV